MMQTHGRTVSKACYSSLYHNVRSECKNPYDFIRELVSNSYDAAATVIDLFPHHIATQSANSIASVLAAYDDGAGMDYLPFERTAGDDERGTPPASSIDAYTQLGHSTNTGLRSIGRFCYGSKQVFNKADAGFMLITRTARMPNDGVLLIDVEDIENEVLREGGVHWRVVSYEEAAEAVRARLQRFSRSAEVAHTVAALSERIRGLRHGTVQIVISRRAGFHEQRLCQMDRQHRYWPSLKKKSRIFKDDIEFSMLYNVIRFSTRHGNALHGAHGHFPGMRSTILEEFGEMGARLMHRARLRIFCAAHPGGYEVPYGYPRPEEQRQPCPPETIRGNRMTDWSGCWARLGPATFTDDGNRSFCVLWDQNSLSTLRIDFESLSRKGNSRLRNFEALGSLASGFRVQACGVRVCDLPSFVIKDLPVHPNSQLTGAEHKMLVAFLDAGEKGGAVCVIEGNFGVEPNRASLSQEEIAGLRRNTLFSRGLANALHALMHTKNAHGAMMMHLLKSLQRSQREIDEQDLEKEAERRRAACTSASRLFLQPTASTPEWLRPLCMTHFVPEGPHSHEQQLQHLVSTFAPFALHAGAAAAAAAAPASPAHGRALALWRRLRPAMHFSAGVDVLALDKAHEGGEADPLNRGHDVVERTWNVEYKWSMPTDFNHPLINTDVVVVWDFDNLVPGETAIEDKQGCDAIVEADPEMDGFALCLRRIRDGENTMMSRRNASREHEVHLVSLRQLIFETFAPLCDVQLHRAHEPAPSHKQKRDRKRARASA